METRTAASMHQPTIPDLCTPIDSGRHIHNEAIMKYLVTLHRKEVREVEVEAIGFTEAAVIAESQNPAG